MKKIICVADFQGQCSKVPLESIPNGDILIVAGDMGSLGTLAEIIEFNDWLGKLSHKHKVVVAGNHDVCLDKQFDGHKVLTNAIYLEDEGAVIDGLKFWGSPYVQPVANWAFMLPEWKLKEQWDLIPNDTDIVVTHMPPMADDRSGHIPMYCWCIKANRHIGSHSLLEAIDRVKPKLHVFGHIHEGYGKWHLSKETLLVNAALCDEVNNLKNKPIIVEL